MKRKRLMIWISLSSIILFSIFIRTIPLFKYSMWGVDCGEYVYYANKWITNGTAYLSIDGWGQSYPYFPGLFIISGSLNLTTNISILTSTVFLPAIISSFVPLIIFLLVYRVTQKLKESLISSIFLTVVAPFVYNYSQPKPETIGAFLMLLILLFCLILSNKNKKIFILIIPSSIALIITHHLSTYFLMLFLIGGYFISEIVRRSSDEDDKFRLYTFLFILTITLLYWFFYADPFRKNRLYNALGLPSYSIIVIPFVFVLFIFILVKFRRKTGYILPINIHKQNLYNFLLFAIPAIIVSTGLLLYSGFYKIPGREIKLGSQVFIYIPLLFLGIFTIEARKVIKVFKNGMNIVGWLFFGLLSLTGGIITGSTSLLPMRHVSFILMPLSILLGLGIKQVYINVNPFDKKTKKIAFLVIVFILLMWSVPFSYPSQDMANGYQEGTEWADLEAGFWVRNSEDKVATDHRMSASYFGLNYGCTTWTEGKAIYFDSDKEKIKNEIKQLNISYILWDKDMLRGVTTTPGAHPYRFNRGAISYYKTFYSVYKTEEVKSYKI